jgi:hypothetical protein
VASRRRFFRPAGFIVAGLLMVMPFISVSCDVPGGYGRAAPGGTTKYSGIDLMVGGEPAVDPLDKLREGPSAQLAPQPLAILTLLMLIAGVVISLRIGEALVRRATIALLSGAAAIALVVNQITVQSQLQERVAPKYVHNQPGFWLCLATLVIVMAANAVAWLRSASQETKPETSGELSQQPKQELLDEGG